jgi:hypothetical protein
VRRRLAESPVLSVDELTEEQAEWWRRNRNREREWFADRLGLDLELRAEGAVAIDPAGELTDVEFPGAGSARQLALLLVEHLADALRPAAREDGVPERIWRTATPELVAETLTSVLAEWGAGLKREHRESAEVALADARSELIGAGLVRLAADGSWLVSAAAARYTVRASLAELLAEPADDGQPSLFGEVT